MKKFDETINTEMILDFRFQAKSLDIPPYELGEKNKNSNVDRVFNNKEISASNWMNGTVQNNVTETIVQVVKFKCKPPENLLIKAKLNIANRDLKNSPLNQPIKHVNAIIP